MTDFNDLARQLLAYSQSLNKQASDTAVKVATAIVNNLIEVTPVDTSQALSNWQIGLGTPVSSTIPPYVPGTLGYTAIASQSAAIEAAQSALQGKQPGQTIYISNNLDYIQALDDGSSQQEPANFVARAVLIGRLILTGKM